MTAGLYLRLLVTAGLAVLVATLLLLAWTGGASRREGGNGGAWPPGGRGRPSRC